MIERRPALGKGLSALIPDAPEPARTGAIEVDIDLLAPNDQQPRLDMDEAKLEELTASIRANGIIQPILVRRTGTTYRIIAGERRWRAAQRAGLPRRSRSSSATFPTAPSSSCSSSRSSRTSSAKISIRSTKRSRISVSPTSSRLTQDQIAAAVGKDRSFGRQLSCGC